MFSSERDMVSYPVRAIFPGLVGPGGMVVESVTPEPGGKVAIDLGSCTAHLPEDDTTGLLFPVRPIRPENASDPTVAWLPEDREAFYRELSRR